MKTKHTRKAPVDNECYFNCINIIILLAFWNPCNFFRRAFLSIALTCKLSTKLPFIWALPHGLLTENSLAGKFGKLYFVGHICDGKIYMSSCLGCSAQLLDLTLVYMLLRRYMWMWLIFIIIDFKYSRWLFKLWGASSNQLQSFRARTEVFRGRQISTSRVRHRSSAWISGLEAQG